MDKDHISVCNVASISLPAFITEGKFNHEKLHEVVRFMTGNLDLIIDKN